MSCFFCKVFIKLLQKQVEKGELSVVERSKLVALHEEEYSDISKYPKH